MKSDKRPSGRPKGVRDKAKRKPRSPNRSSKLTRKQLSEILTLELKGVPREVIGMRVGVSKAGVNKIVKDFEPVLATALNIEKYRKVREDLLTAIEVLLLRSMMSPEKLDKAAVNQLAFAFQKIFQARRLEEQKPTAINLGQKMTTTYTKIDIEANTRKS